MNIRIALVLLTILAVAGCGGQGGSSEESAAVSHEGHSHSTEQESFQKAKPFELEDLKGTAIGLYGDDGKMPVTVLVFWATWCPSCREEIPEVKAFQDEYSDKGVRVLSVSVDKGGGNVASFAEKAEIDYPVLLDRDSAVAMKYGVTGIPNVLVLDRDGGIHYNGHSVHEAVTVVSEILGSVIKEES